jgi:hypothetical protein
MFKIKSIFNSKYNNNNIDNLKFNAISNSYSSNTITNSYSSNTIVNRILRSDLKMVRISPITKDKYWSVISYEEYLSNKYLYMYDYGKLCYKESILKDNIINLGKIIKYK